MFVVGQKVKRVAPFYGVGDMKKGHIYTVTAATTEHISLAECVGIWRTNKFEPLVPEELGPTVVAQPQSKIVRYNYRCFE